MRRAPGAVNGAAGAGGQCRRGAGRRDRRLLPTSVASSGCWRWPAARGSLKRPRADQGRSRRRRRPPADRGPIGATARDRRCGRSSAPGTGTAWGLVRSLLGTRFDERAARRVRRGASRLSSMRCWASSANPPSPCAPDGLVCGTTVTRELLALPSGALLIDTPGLREVGLWDGAGDTFADVDALAVRCRFADCAHDTEPGCAVRAALDPDRIAAWRKPPASRHGSMTASAPHGSANAADAPTGRCSAKPGNGRGTGSPRALRVIRGAEPASRLLGGELHETDNGVRTFACIGCGRSSGRSCVCGTAIPADHCQAQKRRSTSF